MRIGELSSTSGVPVSTIKYYLREGLLPTGRLTSANQAQYDDHHLRRLTLVRALVDVGGLSIATVREVLEAVDASDSSAVRLVHDEITAVPPTDPDADAEQEALSFLSTCGLPAEPGNPATRSLVAVVATARRLGHPHFTDQLGVYADACRQIAEADVDRVMTHSSVEDVLEGVVVGTVLGDAAMVALRRLAQLQEYRRQSGSE
ncbi:MerR family transcriptional regulator [Lentzea kentuckyensis]|uniref:MerR family transcriptional regulator n=1 Tax=Lentzea kentuckyensis TaxID=360086 RepID=UPI000A384838|nr:MerR family transcriptional regulator [Lentzea kentuckyensis]